MNALKEKLWGLPNAENRYSGAVLVVLQTKVLVQGTHTGLTIDLSAASF